MNKLLATLSISTLFLTSCIDQLTQFDMDFTSEVVIPSTTGVNLPFNIFTPNIETNSESTFEANKTGKNLIEEILLAQLDITITSPINGNFGFLNSIEIYISADGLPEERIAFKLDIPQNTGNYLELETEDIDLKDYIKKDEFSLRVRAETDEVLTSDYHIDVHTVFDVDAKILV